MQIDEELPIWLWIIHSCLGPQRLTEKKGTKASHYCLLCAPQVFSLFPRTLKKQTLWQIHFIFARTRCFCLCSWYKSHASNWLNKNPTNKYILGVFAEKRIVRRELVFTNGISPAKSTFRKHWDFDDVFRIVNMALKAIQAARN